MIEFRKGFCPAKCLSGMTDEHAITSFPQWNEDFHRLFDRQIVDRGRMPLPVIVADRALLDRPAVGAAEDQIEGFFARHTGNEAGIRDLPFQHVER